MRSPLLLSFVVCAVSVACGVTSSPAGSPQNSAVSGQNVASDPKSAAMDGEAEAADSGSEDVRPAVPPPEVTPPEPLVEARFKEPLSDVPTEEQARATRAANSSPGACRAELKRRKLPVTLEKRAAPGVAWPVRLADEIAGVRFVTPGKKSVYGIFDCRLVLVVDELAKVLAREGVVAVHVDNAYRPRAKLPGKRKKSQHAYGLAIDIYGFTLADGTTLIVERDYQGSIGAPSCGPLATVPETDANAVRLRNVVCAVARSRVFNYLLTPNFDTAHSNHVHADIARGARNHVVR